MVNKNGFIVVDNYGRYLGEHTCTDNRHRCFIGARDAKRNAQAVAFTTLHPAYVIYEAWKHHLSTEENSTVDAAVPGNGLIAV